MSSNYFGGCLFLPSFGALEFAYFWYLVISDSDEAARQNKKRANTQESTRQLRLWLPFWPRFRLTCIKVIDRHFKVRKRRKKQKWPNEDLYSQKTNLHRFGFRIFKGQLKLLAKHWAPDCFCLFSFSYTSSSEYCGFCGFSFNVWKHNISGRRQNKKILSTVGL